MVRNINAFCDALLTEKADVAEKIFSDYMQKTISVRDTFVARSRQKKIFIMEFCLEFLGFKEKLACDIKQRIWRWI